MSKRGNSEKREHEAGSKADDASERLDSPAYHHFMSADMEPLRRRLDEEHERVTREKIQKNIQEDHCYAKDEGKESTDARRVSENIHSDIVCATGKNEDRGSHRCGDGCPVCGVLFEGKSHGSVFNSDGTIYQMEQRLTCKSSKCIFIIQCGKCGEIYMGATKDAGIYMTHFRGQLSGRLASTALSRHINGCGHGEYDFMPIYHYSNDDDRDKKLNDLMAGSRPKINLEVKGGVKRTSTLRPSVRQDKDPKVVKSKDGKIPATSLSEGQNGGKNTGQTEDYSRTT